jgi:NAD(P)-dependent dehydrogenase (short-subunit alcohol dehydrogenase family)
MNRNIEKVAIITGGSSGIGRASAIRLAKSGVKVAILDLKEEDGEQLRQEIAEAGGEAMALQTDVSDTKDLEASF